MTLHSKNARQKLRHDSFTFRVTRDILKLLDAGNYPAKIARMLGMSRQHVGYYVKKLVSQDMVQREVRDSATFYSLTERGKNFLVEMEKGFVPCRTVRLHNVVFLFPVVVAPRVVIDWRRVELQNWTQLVGSELGLTVRKNPDSMEVFCDVVEGSDPYELMLRAYEEAGRLATHLEQKFQMKLGRPSLSRKPHFHVADPVAEHVGKFMEFSDDIGKVDESEGYGELDLYDPNFVKNYMVAFTTLPSLVQRQNRELSEIKEALNVFAEGMKQHMALISELRETTKGINVVVTRLEHLQESKEKPKPFSLEEWLRDVNRRKKG